MKPVLGQATEPGSNLTIHPFPLDLGLGDEPVDPNDLPQPPDPFWRWVDDAFADAYSSYLDLIRPLLHRAGYPRRSAQPEDLDFPSIVIGIEAAWQPDDLEPTSGKPDPKNVIDSEKIVFDGDLLAQLLEIYTFDGWRPLVTIGKELKPMLDRLEQLEQKAREGRAQPSDLAEIDRLAKWKPAEWLFRMARNCVGLLVRRELERIETIAGLHLQTQAAEHRKRFSALTDPLEWQNPPRENLAPEGGEGPIMQLQLKDRNLAGKLKKALDEPVRCRRQLDLTLKELTRRRRDLANTQPDGEGGTGAGPGADEKAAGGAGGGPAVIRKKRAEIERGEKDAVKQAQALAEATKKYLADKPLLLLVLPSLNPGFALEKMEDALWDATDTLTKQLAVLAEHVRSDPPHTHGVDMLELPPVALHLASFKPPGLGHERDIVQRAIDGFAGADPSWFPLLSSKTLDALVANGEIDTGSFTYVVCAQYLQTLALALDAKARKEEASAVFWERLSQIAAAVSLFLFPFGPLPALLRAGLWIGDMLLLGRSYLTAWQQLNQIDGLLGQTLAEASPAAYALASIGDLLGTRRELIDNVSEQTAIVFVVTIISRADPKLMSAGRVRSAVELTHGLLTAHGYYQDVQILLTAASGANE